jgi:hypothetical protein
MKGALGRFAVQVAPGAEPARRTTRAESPAPGLRFFGRTSLDWLRKAAELPGRALHVAIALKLQADLERSTAIKSQRALVESFGVDRYAERRALAALAEAGLIRLVRHRGRRPVVEVIGAGA